jgi:hypothetical protein
MPSALYAISYGQTGLVLSFCELAKQDLSKAGAVKGLLDQIVGTQLQLQFLLPPLPSPPDRINIDKAQLSLDEVNIAPADIPNVTDFMTACLTKLQTPPPPPPPPLPVPLLDLLMLDLSDPTAKAGDGTVKKLIDPTQLKTATLDVQAGVGLQVTVPAAQFAGGTRLIAIIDGTPQPPFDVPLPLPPPPIVFPFAATASSWYKVVFATRGYKPFFGLLQAH